MNAAEDTKGQILKVMDQLQRFYGKVTTRELATRIYLSEKQTGRYLKALQDEGKIRRVGQRGGWRKAA